MRYVLSLILFLFSVPARAQVAGQPCQNFGQMIVAEDKQVVLACLRPPVSDPGSPLSWMLNTVAPNVWQPVGSENTDVFYTVGKEEMARE